MARHLGTSLNLPYAEVEAALKRGKAVFSWKQLRQWMTVKASGPLLEHDDLSVELPLPVLTPLFLARRPVSERVKTLAPSADIPDVFNTRPASGGEPGSGTISLAKAMAAPAAAAAASESRSVAATVKADISAPGAPIRMERAASLEAAPALPSDAVQRACQLKGVAGALIGTPDGLVIASRWPAPLSADIAAGFLPQVFNRLGQATAELKLGEVGQVELLLGSVPLLIIKLSTAYFAVLGKAGEPLPKTPLCALAGQLSQRSN
jgi:predicted regulator of Ras-like GTPase activity (Roadblock/LC7/MglB family)